MKQSIFGRFFWSSIIIFYCFILPLTGHMQGYRLSEKDTNRKDYKAAVKDFIKIQAFNDSLLSDKRINQLKDLEIRYRVETKENENKFQNQKILLLSEQQRRQHAEIKSGAIARNVILISALFAILTAILIYRQYLHSRKNSNLIAEKNMRLQRLVDENDWLMKEMHHRVKNNLQIVTSLLNSQSKYLDDDAALDAIMKSKRRIEAIALIHQKLYKTDNQSSIYIPEYVQELVDYLKKSYSAEQEIYFDLSLETINLDIADAVPVGLIINECVTNSLKHAFVKDKGNLISISLRRSGIHMELLISDNGKGFDEGEPLMKNSFGLLLIKGLVEDLGGEMKIQTIKGTRTFIAFRPTFTGK